MRYLRLYGLGCSCLVAVAAAQNSPVTPDDGEKALADGRYKDAEAVYLSLKKSAPAVAEIRARLGLVYFQEKQFALAVPELRQALKWKPALPNTELLLAMSLSELGRYSEALSGLEKGFRRTADPVLKRMAGLQLERSYTGLQQDQKAVAVALELAKLYPNDPEVLYHSSRLFGNFAYVTLLKLATVASDSSWRHLASGESYESQGQYNLAIFDYRKVLELDPSRPGLHYRIGRAILTQSLKENARADGAGDAAKEFEAELQLDPTNGNAAYELAEILRRLEKYEQAESLFTAAINCDPQFGEAEIGLGRTLLAVAKPDQALTHLKKAVVLDPQSEVAFYHLSQACRQLGDASGQKQALSEFARLRSARKARKQLPLQGDQVTKQHVDGEP